MQPEPGQQVHGVQEESAGRQTRSNVAELDPLAAEGKLGPQHSRSDKAMPRQTRLSSKRVTPWKATFSEIRLISA